MYRVLVYYPKIDTTKIENFRRKYDLTFKVIKAHITIVFPFQDKETGDITKHIKTVLRGWKPFNVTLEGFTKSKDFYDDTILGSGRLDLFIPHVSLGGFAKRKDQSEFDNYSQMHDYKEEFYFDEKAYMNALEEVEKLDLIYPIKIEELTLVDLNESFTISKDIETILL
ncbi:MAG: 2'-5' RNA ligase family protein [Candidatus Heimdallarchaeaceae archaeon]|jgi:hypothetical protein